MKHLILIALLSILNIACSITVFDDLEDQAPAEEIGQKNEDTTRPFIGVMRLNQQEGGAIFVAEKGDRPLFLTSTFEPNGSLSQSQSKSTDYDDELGLLGFSVQMLASAPIDKTLPTSSLLGPFAYIGATNSSGGKVVIADVNSYKQPYNDGTIYSNESGFGTSLASASWVDSEEDLAITAAGKVYFMRASPWPSFDKMPASGYPLGEATQTFKSIAVGNFDPTTPGDELAIATPDRNEVYLIYGIDSCFIASSSGSDAGSGTPNCENLKHFKIDKPTDASLFGTALLAADIDEDGRDELIIGAPSTKQVGAIYIYSFDSNVFINQKANSPLRTIHAPAEINGFGQTLAYGRLDGRSQPLLAVGAPNSAVNGKTDAGAIILYRAGKETELNLVENTITMSSLGEGDQLGSHLATMPFRKGSEIKETLVANTKDALIVFFASTTSTHSDYRN